MRAPRTKPWTSRLWQRPLAAWLALGLLAAASPAFGQRSPTLLEEVALFEFELVEGPETNVGYFNKIRSLVMYSLEDELERQVDIVTRHRLVPGDRERAPEELKQETGAEFAIFGKLEVLGGNVWITADWVDLDSGRRGTDERPLGKRTLENFDEVEGQGRELALALIEAMVSSREEPGPEGEAVLVSCFRGGEAVDMGFLDRFLTFELPPILEEALSLEGVPPHRLRVEGLSFEWYEECAGPSGVIESALAGLARFVLSGSVLPADEGFLVQVRMQDNNRRIRIGERQRAVALRAPLTIGEFAGGRDFKQLPATMARRLAESLVVYLVQDRLSKAGFDPARIDGTMRVETESALRQFQEANGLAPSGRIDPATLAALELGGDG